MPLIKPEVQKILRAAGLSDKSDSATLDEQLTEAGLSSEQLAENLAGIALRSGNDGLRLRAIETVLKVKGAMKEQVTALPNFTIIIQNFSPQELGRTSGANPILFPRQSLALGGGLVDIDKTSDELEDEIDDIDQES